ncbi:MAG TPA: sigma-70 family RNA polymerase sigma factor [Candidatus Babeliales bacterium]|nr:sigma-70 family RNA polymerase sigma factor [Candidatus Babeliales bacterium]
MTEALAYWSDEGEDPADEEFDLYPDSAWEPEAGLAIEGLTNVIPFGMRDVADTTPLDPMEAATDGNIYSTVEDLLDKIEDPDSTDLEDEEIRTLEAQAIGTQDPLYGDVLDHIKEGAGKAKLLSAAEVVMLAKRIERGDSSAKDDMIVSNLRLVISIASNHMVYRTDFPDLIQDGTIGLIRAVEKFDWRKGFKFSTYATWWIRQACQRGNVNTGRLIRLPLEVVDCQRKIEEAQKKLRNELDRVPTPDEVREEANLTTGQYKAAMRAPKVVASLNKEIGDSDDGAELGQLLADQKEVEIADQAVKTTIHDALIKAMPRLSDREKEVIIRRFGLAGQEPETLTQVCKRFGRARQTILNIETEALKKLSESEEVKCAVSGTLDTVPRRELPELTINNDGAQVTFSPRQHEILTYLSRAFTVSEIVAYTRLPHNQVKTTLQEVYKLLGVKKSNQAKIKAHDLMESLKAVSR